MGFKGLIRDSIMFVIGIMLLFGFVEPKTAAIALIVISVVFTALAWLRMIKGW